MVWSGERERKRERERERDILTPVTTVPVFVELLFWKLPPLSKPAGVNSTEKKKNLVESIYIRTIRYSN